MMKKIKEFFEEEMSGEPLTQEKVEWALEKFANLAWEDGFVEGYIPSENKLTCKDFLNKSYSEREQELVHINDNYGLE